MQSDFTRAATLKIGTFTYDLEVVRSWERMIQLNLMAIPLQEAQGKATSHRLSLPAFQFSFSSLCSWSIERSFSNLDA